MVAKMEQIHLIQYKYKDTTFKKGETKDEVTCKYSLKIM